MTMCLFPLRMFALAGVGCCMLAGFGISGVASSQQHYAHSSPWSEEQPNSNTDTPDHQLYLYFRSLYSQIEYAIRPIFSKTNSDGTVFAAASRSEYNQHGSYVSTPLFAPEEGVNYSNNLATQIIAEPEPSSLIYDGTSVFPSPFFDASKTTEENYRVLPADLDNMQFTTEDELRHALISQSRFRSIRRNLDYSYHAIYSLSRQRFQDELIQSLLEKARPSRCQTASSTQVSNVNQEHNQHWIVFTAGVMGSGKSFTLEWLGRHGIFPLSRFVSVDPDHIRRLLPEFDVYLQRGHANKAGESTRKEAGMLTEVLTTAALNRGQHVVVDGTLRDSDWYLDYFAKLRKEYPGIKIAIIHVTASPESVLMRARKRAKVTGRVVPEDLLQKVMNQVPASVRILKEKVDVFVELFNGENDGSTEEESNIQLVEPATWTWRDFAQTWEC